MTTLLRCIDTNIFVAYLSPEDLHSQAAALMASTLNAEAHLVAPAWLWAEFGSVMRKKTRTGLLRPDLAAAAWQTFLELPITFIDGPGIRLRAGAIAEEYGLLTLYDAAFMACTELAPGHDGVQREFWTADRALLRQLGPNRPAYVHGLT